MGYRSDVAYVIKFENLEQRDAFVTLMLAKNEPYTTQVLDEVKYDYKNDPLITFSDSGWKWYEIYPEVIAHHKLMTDAAELYQATWRFMRMGEDSDDTEVQTDDPDGDLYDYIYLIRDVGTDFPAE